MSESPRRHLRVINTVEEAVPAPRVWLLLGERQGDNAQVLALGRALMLDLGWDCAVKQIRFDPTCEVPFHQRGATLIGVDVGLSDALSAPWPDVIVAVGRRLAPVSRWIKEQTGGRLLNVHLGRPRIAYHHFDLIVTTPQYGLPPGPNVTTLTLPIIMHDDAALDAEARHWEPQLRNLPRPWTAVFVGGPTSQLRFDREVGSDLLIRAKAHVAGANGSLLVTTSPRTTMDVADLFENEIGHAHFLHRWSRHAPNPYQAFLRLADDFIVTNDSVSMIAEAVDLMKPLYVFQVPRREKRRNMGLIQTIRHYFRSRRETRRVAGLTPDFSDRFYDAMTRFGHARPRRSVDAFERRLYQAGLARPLGPVEATVRPRVWNPRRVPKEERDMVVARIRDQFAAKRAEQQA
ncbi:mitochondrial fission ELM1 family protein [Dongia sedimenti]|uniref:ELM1/GtrOC1 family putative glycosyltransferase n=1 Tax=Dongia sedimenti TaxID=3064282 RepID=A0ABU0YJT1_9PROT|nr:ELM1/GtrOC1 family putative glycosyltransferase [Rhodospirillaceae bacterium R-7]